MQEIGVKSAARIFICTVGDSFPMYSGGRKGAEPFVWVLVAGIAIFGLAMLLSLVPEDSKFRSPSQVLQDIGPGFQFGKGAATEELIIYQSDVGRLGALQTKRATSSLGTFKVGRVLDRQAQAEKSAFEIRRGLLASRQALEFAFSGNDTTKAILVFDVANTNLLSDLVIEFNGNKIYSNITSNGSYQVEIDDIAESNTLEVYAKMPGLRFWASSVYQLTGIMLEADRYAIKENTVSFPVQQEVFEKWVQGNFVFKVPNFSPEGPLVVEVNGNEVYNDRVYTRLVRIPFAKFENQIVPGENVVRFRTNGSGFYEMEDVVLDIEYTGGTAAATIKSFIIPPPIFADFAAGNLVPVLKFDFKEISQAPITLSLNERDFEFPNLDLQFNNQTAELELAVNDIAADFNIIKFATTGVYDIFNLRFVGIPQGKIKEKERTSLFTRTY